MGTRISFCFKLGRLPSILFLNVQPIRESSNPAGIQQNMLSYISRYDPLGNFENFFINCNQFLKKMCLIIFFKKTFLKFILNCKF